MVVAEILGMAGSSAVGATLPSLISGWALSPAQAGLLGGAYFAGYVCAVPLLVTLTDRIDARPIFAAGAVMGILSNAGFALANGYATALVFWFLGGVSLAGLYMPGLRVIIDRLDPGRRLRAVPYYTASFGIGISLSFLIAGSAAQAAGWRAAFVAGAAGCGAALLALACATAGTRAVPAASRPFDLSLVLHNKRAMRYIVAYGGHCWELFALRAWLVALLLVAWNRTNDHGPGGALTYWSALIAFAGVPASIAGAEAALHWGRARVVFAVAGAAVAVAAALALWGTLVFLGAAAGLLVYTVVVLGDSSALTTGVVEAAHPGAAGATLALHSLVGFLGGALGPVAAGIALSLSGGVASSAGWPAIFGVMAAGSVVAALAVRGVSAAPASAPASV